jgi:hypothetical protein
MKKIISAVIMSVVVVMGGLYALTIEDYDIIEMRESVGFAKSVKYKGGDLVDIVASKSEAHALFKDVFFECMEAQDNQILTGSCMHRAEGIVSNKYGNAKSAEAARLISVTLDHIKQNST